MTHQPDSLWSILNNFIREHGVVTYGHVCQKTAEEGYKVSTAERRLRKSESPCIEPIMAISKRNTEYIAGYKWIGEPIIAPKESLIVSHTVNGKPVASNYPLLPKEFAVTKIGIKHNDPA